ncbi:N-acetylmuramidase family protein [Rheinheimera salexigens]|uniref:N-acetylmuramidase domain-containing protein n=1 Tax=Rheinheimera salexigens TaxID=1628148 RepID=A0A1E7Q3M3_9GAMM|nr:N-acetylmuramidase family protein [Rheinheimera salexigens]OEY68739.1 hypothetical protein BI198_03510 [Rheinheimera salexigens]
MPSLHIAYSVGMAGVNIGSDIKAVQIALNTILALTPLAPTSIFSATGSPIQPLVIDGFLGAHLDNSKTVAAIKLFQSNVVGLANPNGKIEPNDATHRKINTTLAAAYATPYQLPRVQSSAPPTAQDYNDIAQTLGCEVAAIKAVAQVECSGEAYFSNGRPKILFEAHIFSRLTQHRYDISQPTISSRSWNPALYTGGNAEYYRLEQALALDPLAALQSASWGRFQIMGFNYQACGYRTVQAFVQDMFCSETKQLEAFVGFIKYNSLDIYLQNKDWSRFARGYNGPGYAENKYDIKIRAAYKTFSRESA